MSQEEKQAGSELSAGLGTRRYQVCKFPSLYGTPWETNSYPVAVLYAVLRFAGCFGMGEIRVIDNITYDHPIVW